MKSLTTYPHKNKKNPKTKIYSMIISITILFISGCGDKTKNSTANKPSIELKTEQPAYVKSLINKQNKEQSRYSSERFPIKKMIIERGMEPDKYFSVDLKSKSKFLAELAFLYIKGSQEYEIKPSISKAIDFIKEGLTTDYLLIEQRVKLKVKNNNETLDEAFKAVIRYELDNMHSYSVAAYLFMDNPESIKEENGIITAAKLVINNLENDIYCGDVFKLNSQNNEVNNSLETNKCLQEKTRSNNYLTLAMMKYLQIFGNDYKKKTLNNALSTVSRSNNINSSMPENHLLETADWLINLGGEVNYISEYEKLNNKNWSMLNEAITYRHFKLANYLIDNGADASLSSSTDSPYTKSQFSILLNLINQYSKSNVENYTTYELGSLYKLAEKVLLSGAIINEKNGEGMTPIMLASKHGNEYLTKALLDAGAKANELHKIKKWEVKQSAISIAANYYSFNLEPIFINYGYDVGQNFTVTRKVKAKQDEEKEIKIAQEIKEEEVRLVEAKKTAITHPFLATITCNFGPIIGCLGGQGSINYKSHNTVVSLSRNDFYSESEFKVPLSKSFIFKVQNGEKRHASIDLTITDILDNKIVYSNSTNETYGILSVEN